MPMQVIDGSTGDERVERPHFNFQFLRLKIVKYIFLLCFTFTLASFCFCFAFSTRKQGSPCFSGSVYSNSLVPSETDRLM